MDIAVNEMDRNSVVLSDGTVLSQDQLKVILSHIEFDRLKSSVESEIKRNEFDLDRVLPLFLEGLVDRTRKTYEGALSLFLSRGYSVLDLSPMEADGYVDFLRTIYAPNSVRTHVTALSSFFSKLRRWGYITLNPFHGTNTPASERSRDLVVPSEREVEVILDTLANRYEESSDHRKQEAIAKTYMAVWLMGYGGFRVGALANIKITEGRYQTYSKGRVINGVMPEGFKAVMSRFGFDTNVDKPFVSLKKQTIQYNISSLVNELFSENILKSNYHAHSFRHFFAVQLYKKTSDIYVVSKKLNHVNVAVTQRYLDSLGLIGG